MTRLAWLPPILALALAVVVVAAVQRRTRGAAGRRFFASPAAGLGLGLLVFLAAVAVFAPLVAPYRPAAQLDIVELQTKPRPGDTCSAPICSAATSGAASPTARASRWGSGPWPPWSP